MKSWSRPLGFLLVIAVIAGAYFIGHLGRNDGAGDAAAGLAPNPGYAARDAVVIETGYDGRERYRLNAKVVRQQGESGAIELEQLQMDYHPGAQDKLPGEKPVSAAVAGDVWHLKADRGQVQADGDDVQLNGNVQVAGRAPGTNEPITLATESMHVNTPTQFIETKSPVTLTWSGYDLTAVGMQADLKAGTLRLESQVHGEFLPK